MDSKTVWSVGRADRAERTPERGSALVAVLVMAALSVLVLSSLSRSMIEAEIAGRAVESSEAFYLAEAGLQHAIVTLIESPDGLTDELLGPDGKEGTADDGYLLGLDPVPFGDGSYLARVVNNWNPSCTGKEDSDSDDLNDGLCDVQGSGSGSGSSPNPTDGDGIAHLWVLGMAGDSRSALRATIDVAAGDKLGTGIYTNGVITSGRGAKIRAAESTIHGNGGLVLESNSEIDGAPGTSAAADVAPGTKIDGKKLDAIDAADYEDAHSNLTPIDIPAVDPADYRHLADYRFGADGKVYDANDNLVGTDEWNNWKFSKGGWKLNNVKGGYQPMVGYFETDVFVSAQDDIVTTILAEGSVQVNGGQMSPAADDLLIVTGGDAYLGGNAKATAYSGNVYVREQLRTAGSSGLRGNIVVEDAADDHSLVTGDAVQIGSDIIVDPSLRNTIGSDGAGLTEWYLDLHGDWREIFR